MSSDDDIDAFNDFVKKNKEKLKHKFIESPELKRIDNEMNCFIADSESDILFSNSDSSDCNLSPHIETNNRQIKKHLSQSTTRNPDLETLQKSQQNPNRNLSPLTDSSDKNRNSKFNDLNLSDNLFSEDSFSNFSDNSDSLSNQIPIDNTSNFTEASTILLTTEVNKKLDLDDVLPFFKTPKCPVKEFDKTNTADSLKPTTNPGAKSINLEENKENLRLTTSKKIDLSSLIKTCQTKDINKSRKFSRLIAESSSESDTFESSDNDDSFIDDSILSDDSQSDASDGESCFSGSSSDSDKCRLITTTPKLKLSKQIPQTVPEKLGRNREKLDFISSLLDSADNERRNPDAIFYRLKYKSHHKQLAEKIYQIYNKTTFNSLLPESIEIEWSTTLRKTAGKCFQKRQTTGDQRVHFIKIQLSKKVLTDAERLLKTLVHEMCHGAVWMIDKVNGGHGPLWKNWVEKAHRSFPDVTMSKRCHNYKIHCKFEYVCLNCNRSIGRHSKSIDMNKKVCGICKGKFKLFRIDQKGSRIVVDNENKKLNGFSIFVKEHYNKYRKPGISHTEAMKKLSELYKTANKPSNGQDLCSMIGSMNLVDKS